MVRDEDDAVRNSTILAAGLAYKTLPDIIQKLQKRLNELVDFAHENLLRNGKGLPHLGLSARRKKQLVDIRDNISDAHRNLQLVLLSANLSVWLQPFPMIATKTKVNDSAVAETDICCQELKRLSLCIINTTMRPPLL